MTSDHSDQSANPVQPAAASDEEGKQVERRLLELLVCPLTKSTLEYREETNELISRQARLAYPIVDGIPLMTTDAARNLTDEDLANRR